jgi:hypothetical protein
MAIADFYPQTSSTLTAVRYYTQFDPYFYTVDNRPLSDLATNITAVSSGGGDSARRAVLVSQLVSSGIMNDLYYTSNVNGFYTGLDITYPAVNTINVSPGYLYQEQVINVDNANAVVKQAMSPTTEAFTVTIPGAGLSQNWLIQGQYQDLTSANMETSNIPYLDSTNVFLPCLLFHGNLALSIVAGTPATTGTQTTPAASAGCVPIYVITTTNGVVNPVVSLHPSAPDRRGLNQTAQPVPLTSGGATYTTVAGVPTLTFAHGSTSSVYIPIRLSGNDGLNPYQSLKFQMNYSSDSSGGNFAIQAQYLNVALAGSTGASYTSTPIEAVAMSGSANTLLTATTATAVIPNTGFAGFLNEVWKLNGQKTWLILSRVGGNASDTNTGNLFLHDLTITQNA